MQVAGSASREHKHDSHNTESFSNNLLGCCVRRKLAGGLKTRDIFWRVKNKSHFYEKDKNRIAKLELIMIYKRRSYQSIHRGIYIGKLAGHISTVIQKKRNRKKE
jgi:hypothetical protein